MANSITETTLFVVEDDKPIADMLSLILTNAGFSVQCFGNTQQVKAVLHTGRVPHLLLLDIMLPLQDGLSFARELRRQSAFEQLPIIMLTARSEEAIRLQGLAMVDDFVVKPFSPKELVARIHAVLRRSVTGNIQKKTTTINREQSYDKSITLSGLTINSQTMMVHAHPFEKSSPLALSPIEFRLLWALADGAPRVFSRGELLSQVWGDGVDIGERTVDVMIRRLRNSLRAVSINVDNLIETVRGVGYRLNDRVSSKEH